MHSNLVRRSAIFGTVLIAILSAVMSFTALSDLARSPVVTGVQAYVWPLIVDGFILVASVCAFALEGARGRWFAWMGVLAGAVLSVWGNGFHAWDKTGSAVAVVVALVPPVALLISTRLTELLVRAHRDARVVSEQVTETPAVVEPVVTEPVPPTPPTDGPGSGEPVDDVDAELVVPSPWPARPVAVENPDPLPAEDLEQLQARAVELANQGTNNVEIGNLIGKSEGTIRRYLGKAEEAGWTDPRKPKKTLQVA